jgi:hypothetical protein
MALSDRCIVKACPFPPTASGRCRAHAELVPQPAAPPRSSIIDDVFIWRANERQAVTLFRLWASVGVHRPRFDHFNSLCQYVAFFDNRALSIVFVAELVGDVVLFATAHGKRLPDILSESLSESDIRWLVADADARRRKALSQKSAKRTERQFSSSAAASVVA